MPVSEEREDVLLLDVPMTGDYLSVLPTATAAVATRLGFSLDAIEDLRAAVNAAVTLLLPEPSRPPSSRRHDGTDALHCRLEVSIEFLQIVLSRVKGEPLPEQGTYHWQVLKALTDEAASESDGTRSVIRIRQQRPASEADTETDSYRVR